MRKDVRGLDPTKGRWKQRWIRSQQVLKDLLDQVRSEEVDWRPDDGIESIRDHLWSIAVSERWLTIRLTKGTLAPVDRNWRAEEVPFAEIVRMLEICQKNLTTWFDDGAPVQESDAESSTVGESRGLTVDDLLYHHLEQKAAQTASIRSLVHLIDPSRRAALLS